MAVLYDSRQIADRVWTHVLQARFRVYGNVAVVQPDSPEEAFDLAHVFAGGRVTFVSDQHFGVGENLILPGRGECLALSGGLISILYMRR